MAYPKLNDCIMNARTKTVVLLTGIEECETKSGRPYCHLSVSDGETTVNANIWDTAKSQFKIPEGNLMAVEIKKSTYNDNPTYEICRYGNAPADADIQDYILHAPYSGEEMFKGILNLMEKECKGSPLTVLVSEIYNEHKGELLYWSAAKSIHHNFHGGLLYHTLRMIRSGCMLARVYPSLKKDVLLAGIALHDIGKLEELETTPLGVADYTVDGSLFSHVYLGMRLVEEKAKKQGTQEDLIRQVLHIIAAHHGQLEWGALSVPATPEAMVCHQIDMIDSRIEQFEKTYEALEPGTMSERIFGLGTRVYKPL